jgi:hypothetical protein
VTLSAPTLSLLNTVGLTSRRVAELEKIGMREAARRLAAAGAVVGHRSIWRTPMTPRTSYGQRVIERKT